MTDHEQVKRSAVGAVPLRRALPDSTPGRLVRAAVFAVLTIVLADVSHRLAGGTGSSSLLAVAFVVLLAAGWRLSRRECSGRLLALVVIGSQLGLHLALVLPNLLRAMSAGSGSSGLTDAQLSALLFCHHGAHQISAAQLHQAAAGLDLSRYHTAVPGVGALVLPAVLMLGAHLLAAGLLAWWLRRGERAAWRAWCQVIACARLPLRPTLPAGAPLVAWISQAPRAARSLIGPNPLRGPPACAVPIV